MATCQHNKDDELLQVRGQQTNVRAATDGVEADEQRVAATVDHEQRHCRGEQREEHPPPHEAERLQPEQPAAAQRTRRRVLDRQSAELDVLELPDDLQGDDEGRE